MVVFKSSITRLALCAVGLGVATQIVQAQMHSLIDLGPYPPGLAINNSGQVVLQNYIYSTSTQTLTPFPANFAGAGINAGGQVVGSFGSSCPGYTPLGCAIGVWANGKLTIYPVYEQDPFGDFGNQGWGINASDQIVGDVKTFHNEGGALLLSNGVYSSLQFPSSSCFGSVATAPGGAYAINDAGQIAGQTPQGSAPECTSDAFLLSQSVYHDIGVGQANALNASGQVVGELFFGATSGVVPGPQVPGHAFLYDLSEGSTNDLGTLPGDTTSVAYAINSSTFVVGDSTNANSINGTNTAFLYNGVMNNLNTFVTDGDPLKPYVTLTDARGINDSGLIVVNGVDSRTQAQHTYLLQVPLIQVAPGPLTFPTEPIGSQSSSQTATFTNVGTTSITLSAASVSESFSVHSNSCSGSLAPTAQCAIAVVFAPTTAGNADGNLTLLAGDVPMAVPLSGTGMTPASGGGGSGGGGALDPLALVFLLGVLAAQAGIACLRASAPA